MARSRSGSRGGNAETLRRYWSTGKGGGTVRWNTPGDFTRCVKAVSQYMGPRAKGYCANLHRRNTGSWPGSAKNRRSR